MDKNFAIQFIKFLMGTIGISPEDLGIQSKQKYRPVSFGGKIVPIVNNGKALNGHYIGAFNREKVDKTPVNTQLDLVRNITLVDIEPINSDRNYIICVENK